MWAPIQSIVAGLACGLLTVVLSTSKGLLLFSGGLQEHAVAAIGMALFATVVTAAMCALIGPNRGNVALVQDVPIVALAAVVAFVHASMTADARTEEIVATVVMASVAATVVSAVVALILGFSRLGHLVRFVPYPVIGGFLAGTGWLIIIGGLAIIVGKPMTLAWLADAGSHLSRDPATAQNLGLALATVAFLAVVQRVSSSTLAMPAIVFLIIVAFNAVHLSLGVPLEALQTGGWVVQVPDSASMWPNYTPALLENVDWHALSGALVKLPMVVVVTIMALLLNVTGIEIATRRSADLNGELRAAGFANFVSGLPGFSSVSMTMLAHRLGGRTRLTGLTVAVVALAALAFGAFVIDLMPKFLLGALLIWVGGALLVEWLGAAFRRLSRSEYAIIVLIFIVIAAVNFTTGVLVGMIAAAVLFVVSYGRVDVVRSVETMADDDIGESILIYRLQGFLFFGTADRLRDGIEKRVRESAVPVRYLVLDFDGVSGLDSSTVLSFTRLAAFAEATEISLVLSGLAPDVARTLERGGLREWGRDLQTCSDLDAAVARCEDQARTESETL